MQICISLIVLVWAPPWLTLRAWSSLICVIINFITVICTAMQQLHNTKCIWIAKARIASASIFYWLEKAGFFAPTSTWHVVRCVFVSHKLRWEGEDHTILGSSSPIEAFFKACAPTHLVTSMCLTGHLLKLKRIPPPFTIGWVESGFFHLSHSSRDLGRILDILLFSWSHWWVVRKA